MNFHGFLTLEMLLNVKVLRYLSLTSHMHTKKMTTCMYVCNRCLVEKLVQTYSVVEGLSANNLKVPASNGAWQRQAADPAQMSLDTDLFFFFPFYKKFCQISRNQ